MKKIEFPRIKIYMEILTVPIFERESTYNLAVFMDILGELTHKLTSQ